jgi:hypothetical protein
MSSVRRLSTGLALSIGLALLPTPAQAQVTIYSSYNTSTFSGTVDSAATAANSVSLQALLNGETIQVNDKVFTNFGNFQTSGTGSGAGGLAGGASSILLSGLPNGTTQFPGPLNPGLAYTTATMSLPTSGTLDTRFTYQVFVVGGGPLMEDASQVLNGGVSSATGSSVTVTESVTDAHGSPLASPGVDVVKTAGGFAGLTFNEQFFTPANFANVAKDISLVNNGGTAGQGPTALSGLDQQFSEVNPVPEPSTMAIGGLGALAFIGYGLRRRLKK